MNTIYYKKALVLVWFFFSIISFFSIIAPFILPENTIYRLSPKCEWKAKYNRECIMCGMTSAFIDISKGQLKNASKQNRGSIYLFAVFLLNDFSASVCLLFPKRRRRAVHRAINTISGHRKK